MAEEFVDLYEVLELPIDAERGTLRKRINELYLDAQRNIDHRTFATRVKYQELFEVTLPQARYILLDDGRRDEYNRLVNAFRATGNAASGGPPAPLSAPAPAASEIPLSTGGFSLEPAPIVAPLPETPVDAAKLAAEREELWKKWKSGLESALSNELTDKPKARGAATSAPTSFSVAPAPASAPTETAPTTAAPAPVQAAPVQAAPAPAPAAPTPTPPKTPRPKVEISFDFGDNNAPRRGDSAPVPGAEELVAEHKRLHTPEETEARRNEHRLKITKEILVNVSLIWGILGATFVIVPGLAALIATVGHYYPRGMKPILGYPSMVLWVGGFLLIGVAAFFASRELSKSMRHKKAIEIATMSYEEVLRRHGKT